MSFHDKYGLEKASRMSAWENYDMSLRLVLNTDSCHQIQSDKFSGTEEMIQMVNIPNKNPSKENKETATYSKQRSILKNKQTQKLTTSTAGSITDKARLAVSAVCT